MVNFRLFGDHNQRSVAVWIDGHQVATIYPSEDGRGITIMSGRIQRRAGAVRYREGQPGAPPALTIDLQDPDTLAYEVRPR